MSQRRGGDDAGERREGPDVTDAAHHEGHTQAAQDEAREVDGAEQADLERREGLDLGPYGVRGDLLFVLVVCVASTAALLYVLYRTRLGLATRAVSQQDVAAQLCGIDVHRTNATTFVLAGLLGGIAGAMTASAVGVLSPLITIPLTVKGLIVTVIGGLGSIPGAIVAGLLVGGFENVFLYFRGVNERDMYVLLLLFVFLVFRPQGIFGSGTERD